MTQTPDASGGPRALQPRILSTIGRLPGTWSAFAVILISGLGEGVGIALFVPIIELLEGTDLNAGSWVFRTMVQFLEYIGYPVTVPALLVLMVILVCGSFGLAYLQARMLNQAQYKVIQDLRRRLFEGLFRSKWDYLARQTHGDVVNNLLVESLRYGQALAFEVRTLATLILLVIYLAMGAILSPELLAVTALLGAALALVVRPLLRRSKVLGTETNEANAAFSSHIVEFLRGAKLTKVTGSEAACLDRFGNLNTWLRRIFFHAADNSELLNLANRALPVLFLALIIMLAHSMFEIPTSLILVFLIVMSRIAPRMSQLQQHYNQFVLRAPAIPSIDARISEAEAMVEAPSGGLRRFEALSSEIVFENVDYRFSDVPENALSDISIRIGKCEMVALVGSSGAGKSTLVDMLAALRQPTAGRILIDGVPLADLDAFSWRRRIGYVTQEITLFNDTLRNNLLFVHPEAGEDELWDALRMANLYDVVRDMPDGLETMVGENGLRLSGGQRQRLALARALVGNPEILLLDEATSALDSEAEQAIQATIDQIAKQMTVLIVSHRLSTVRNADRLYVMEAGRIVESGGYDTLVGSGGRLTQLHGLQSA